jgi:DNA-binding protein HU-beta
MDKHQFIDRVAGITGQTKKATGETVNAIAHVIRETVAAGDGITIHGLLSVSVVQKKERVMYSTFSRGPITVPAKNAVKIKPAAVIAKAANGKA